MRRLAYLLAVVLSFPGSLQSQVDTTARIAGTAKSSFDGRPLSGVMISVPEARKFVVTDENGTFLLGGLPIGRQEVSVAYEGRATVEYVFELLHAKTKRLAILLDVNAVDLDPIVVSVRHRDDWRGLPGFYERRRYYSGRGRFWTQQDIQRDAYRSIADLMRRIGIQTGGSVPTTMTRGVPCPITVAIDGFAFDPNEYQTVLIDDVRGVEWYGGFLGEGIPMVPGFITSGTPPRARFYSTGREDPRDRFEFPVYRCPQQTLAIWTR